MADAQAELGPNLPPRIQVYALAAELHVLARLAMEFSMKGATCDLPRALAKLKTAKVLLGEVECD